MSLKFLPSLLFISLLLLRGEVFAQDLKSLAPDCDCQSNWSKLPDEIFEPLVAVVREPQFSIRKENYSGDSGNFNSGSVSFGDYLPVIGYQFQDDSKLQLQIDGAMFALYNLDKPSFDLFNTDYIFGLSLAYRDDAFSTRFRLYHLSSHLGDEFLIENPDFKRQNSSFEEAQLVAAYEGAGLRGYFGGGAIFRSNSLDDLDPLSVRSGLEYRRELYQSIDLLLAVDLSISQRTDWKLSRSTLFGLVVLQNESREVRLMGSYYGGNSPQGQFFEDRIEYIGFGVYFIV